MIRITIQCDYCGAERAVRVSEKDHWNAAAQKIFAAWKTRDGKAHYCPRCAKKLKIE